MQASSLKKKKDVKRNQSMTRFSHHLPLSSFSPLYYYGGCTIQSIYTCHQGRRRFHDRHDYTPKFKKDWSSHCSISGISLSFLLAFHNSQAPQSQFTHVIPSRAPSDHHLTIDSFRLSQLFDAHKNTNTTVTFTLDEDKLVQRLATRYNSPSIGRENTIVLQDGDRRLYREAIWVDAATRS
jgi:hypothetical protein